MLYLPLISKMGLVYKVIIFQLQNINIMSYWDIDQFLAEQQKIPFNFTKEAIGMQFLDPSKGSNGNIDANEDMESPIWVLNILNDYLPEVEEEDYLKVKFPKYLHSKQFQNRVKSFEIQNRNSSLQKVNFQRQSPYFYETYLLLEKLMQQQSTAFDRNLVGMMLSIRGKGILIRASNYVGNTNIDYALNTYTVYESKLYKKTKAKMQEFSAWKYSHKWLDKHSSLKAKTKK